MKILTMDLSLQEWLYAFKKIEKTFCNRIWERKSFTIKADKLKECPFIFEAWKEIKNLYPSAFIAGGFVLYLASVTNKFGSIDVFVPSCGTDGVLSLYSIVLFLHRKYNIPIHLLDWSPGMAPSVMNGLDFKKYKRFTICTQPMKHDIKILLPQKSTGYQYDFSQTSRAAVELVRGFDVPLCRIAIFDMDMDYDKAGQIFYIDAKLCRVSLSRLASLNEWSGNNANGVFFSAGLKFRAGKYRERTKDEVHQPCKLFVECYKICADMYRHYMARTTPGWQDEKLILSDEHWQWIF